MAALNLYTTQKETVEPNISLNKYFKYMVNNRILDIKISPFKIMHIIKNDLCINIDRFSDVLQEVSMEVFNYYMQSWPGWKPEYFHRCIDNTDQSYEQFKKFLYRKIMELESKERNFVHSGNKTFNHKDAAEYDSNILTPPNYLIETLSASDSRVKMKLPYTLEVRANANKLNALCFVDVNEKIVFTFKKYDIGSELTMNEVLNHPFVSVQFKIPSLIKLTRKNVHRIEMFLCKPTDSWTFPIQDHIIDIRKHSLRANIYTWKFMQEFFMQFIEILSDYEKMVSQNQKTEIKAICNEFLHDIKEVDLNNASIQECTEICYNIGKSVYFNDTATRRYLILTPVSSPVSVERHDKSYLPPKITERISHFNEIAQFC